MLARRTPLFRSLAAISVFLVAFYFLNALRSTHRQPATHVRSSFDWSTVQPSYPTEALVQLPSGVPHRLPRIQYQFVQNSSHEGNLQVERRDAVQKSFNRSWKSYKEFAWMKDELKPLTGGNKTTFGGWAATLVDTLDTLWIMDLKQEFHEAVEAAVTLDWANTTQKSCNFFETTIRYLGGLLAAYDLSKESALLAKATELGDMLYTGFDTPTRMPPFWFDFELAKKGQLVADLNEPSATPGSLSLEFTRLSQLTGNPKYYDAIARITKLLHQNQNSTMLPGMWPTFFNLRDLILNHDNSFTLGALADSLYEYLPKAYALLGGLEPMYKTMYLTAAETVKNNLLFRPMTPAGDDILFTGTVRVDSVAWLDPEGQHLACFAGGMFALGGRLFNDQEHVEIGTKLARGCGWAYQAFPTGIMPEVFKLVTCESLEGCQWNETKWKQAVADDIEGFEGLPKGFRNARDPSYILRPEAIESIFILYRITGNEEFRDMAWDMFQAIEKATHTPYANAAIDSVTTTGQPKQRDSMESFWTAETLKYFYLIFSPHDLLSLDDWVLNTEAHPFRIPKP